MDTNNTIKLTRKPNEFDVFFDKFQRNVLTMGLNIKQTDQVFQLSKEMATTINIVYRTEIEKSKKSASEVFKETNKRILDNFDGTENYYKRLKWMKSAPTYVEPQEKGLGMRVEHVKDRITQKITRKQVQTTMQYVPIVETLKSLFLCPKFCQMYFEYNNENQHVCQKDVYERFCCSSRFKEEDIFKRSPSPIELQIFSDEFEPCDALKSKAGLHKTMAVYFQIKNLPPKFLSKLTSIYLVALCNSNDLKTQYSDVNNLLELIMVDVRQLENIGIEISGGIRLHGTIAVMMFDNLGGNVLFGLARSFSATYFCRFCTSDKKETQKMVTENAATIRTCEEYDAILALIENAGDKKMNLKKTKGIEHMCSLNESKYFHILKNWYVDTMHDILEGVGQFLLHHIFNHCINQNIVDVHRLGDLIKYFNYGELNKKNIPSFIKFHSKTNKIGQNAKQTYCLLYNLPFILYPYKTQLKDVWGAVETLLQIMHIVFSPKITENDIKRLTELVESHLKITIEIFKVNLLPKHHLLLHYPRTIRACGPVHLMSTLRMEAKHRFFTDIANRTNNFINIYKTMAYKHQEMIYLAGFTYFDDIEPSATETFFGHCDDFDTYKDILADKFFDIENLFDLKAIKSLRFNNFKYKCGLLIQIETKFIEINYVVRFMDQYWILSNVSFEALRYDDFTNSIVLKEKTIEVQALNIFELNNKKTYNKIHLNHQNHVIVDSLDIYYSVKH